MSDLSPVAEDYLKTVYLTEKEFGRQVRPIEVAEAMDVSSASVTHMIQKLDEEGFVRYAKYDGIETTELGREVVTELVRKHRLIESFLVELPGFSWADVHEEADRLEHHVSDGFVDSLAEYLGNPEVDPHGDPISSTDAEASEMNEYVPLARCESSEEVVVRQVHDRDSDVSSFLYENGISPGTPMVVDDVYPVGLVDIRIEGSRDPVSLPEHVARRVRVEKV